MTGSLKCVVPAAVLLVAWQAMVSLFEMPPFILPGPLVVARTIAAQWQLLGWHAAVTLLEILTSLVLACVLGTVTAIAMAAWQPVRSVVLPVLLLSQAIPIFALAPILTLWLGYGFWSKVMMALLIVYFPVTSSFFDGLMQTPRGWLDLGRQLKASPQRLMWRVRIPAAVPSLASGLRLAAVYAPVGAIIGEWVGASQGLGYLMLFANGRAKIDLMFASLAVLLAVTLTLRYATELVCRSLLLRFPAA
jgi:putative hydroxymethylpyrimidine transport system permease protein